MLVKLGEVWVDPAKVEGLQFQDGMMRITTGNDFYIVNINEKSINDCASIINNALVTQSFGGESNEEASATA